MEAKTLASFARGEAKAQYANSSNVYTEVKFRCCFAEILNCFSELLQANNLSGLQRKLINNINSNSQIDSWDRSSLFSSQTSKVQIMRKTRKGNDSEIEFDRQDILSFISAKVGRHSLRFLILM